MAGNVNRGPANRDKRRTPLSRRSWARAIVLAWASQRDGGRPTVFGARDVREALGLSQCDTFQALSSLADEGLVLQTGQYGWRLAEPARVAA